jgi:uncharacterized phage-associated protein
MLNVLQVAAYLIKRYYDKYKSKMDEMKLHKLLYFTQRESIIQTNNPMFSESFEAWQYGPVMVSVREAYANDNFGELPNENELAPYQEIFNYVIENYSNRSSWTLCLLSHAEESWKKAREGYSENATNCHKHIILDDIRRDAVIARQRRIKTSSISYTL